ncbi:DUF3828 domain-containing protein [Chitinophaga sancti]|nr:DUF3828 domain-containing protein [Chitinophaga sancti]WQD63941.1 DUF3828 domain-containing protein [Chitinophaga sancti]WQG90434.1 DUF3828 domain-containing protein [Chitinophaga sancti]
MKTNFLTSFLACVLTVFSYACSAQSQAPVDKAAVMLKQFYTAYITVISNEHNNDKEEKIRKRYATAKLLKKIQDLTDKEELDYDLFLNAQDADTHTLPYLKIVKDPKKPDTYNVSYGDSFTKNVTNIKVHVIKEGENYKIDDVLN